MKRDLVSYEIHNHKGGVRMVKNNGISLEQRAKALQELLEDAIKLNFSKHLVEDYNKQLEKVKEEIEAIKQKQKEFMKLLNGKTQ